MAKKELEATQNANEAKLMALKAAMSKIEKEQDSPYPTMYALLNEVPRVTFRA